jgi:regulator of sirC expression with transglutaminase-like and TPR domain
MNSIEALLTLLDDPDPVVHDSLVARLNSDRDLLDRAWRAAQERPSLPAALISAVLTADSEELVDNYALVDDLETGVWLLPQLHAPRRDFATPGSATLDQLAERIGCDAEVEEIAHFMCHELGLSGNKDHYHDPLNSYVPFVLERRLGLPITLTAIWMLVGRRLGHELEAVAAPGHVLGRWHGGFIDLFDGGATVTIEELERRVRNAGQPSAMPFLAPASDRALLRRMARNLVNSYSRHGDTLRATIAHGLATA